MPPQLRVSNSSNATMTNMPHTNHLSADTNPNTRDDAMSNSSSVPQTPQRDRRRTRYSELGRDLGRVPLHRRGTSGQYERLEDLLREAGYKETRIITPKHERAEASAKHEGEEGGNAEDRLQQGNRTSIAGAVAGFLASFVPGQGNLSRSSSLKERSTRTPQTPPEIRLPVEDYSPPSSPPHPSRQLKPDSNSLSPPSVHSASSDSLQRPASHLGTSSSSSSSSSLVAARRVNSTRPPYAQYDPTLSSILAMQRSKTTTPISHFQPIHNPRPVPASRAHLRHMASAPAMPPPVQRSDSTPVSSIRTAGLHSDAPPLPRAWLETVANAVSRGGGSSYVGGPKVDSTGPGSSIRRRHSGREITTTSNASTIGKGKENWRALAETPALRHARSVLEKDRDRGRSQSGYGDEGEVTRGRTGASERTPPQLMMATRRKARRSESQVSRTRVVCRSRASSPHRRPSTADGPARPPSLARTGTEGDESRVAALGELERPSDERVEDHDEDDEDILDLARMLIPPKRQNSIRSLRKHLPPPLPGAASQLAQHPESIYDEPGSDDFLGFGLRSGRSGSSSGAGSIRGRYGGRWWRPSKQDEDMDEDEREFTGFLAGFGLSGDSSMRSRRAESVGAKRRDALPAQWTVTDSRTGR